MHEALFDPHASIRELARFELKKSGDVNFADVYRKALAHGASPNAAIAGLGETGAKSDAAILPRYLQSKLNSQRRAAIRSIRKLAGEDHFNSLFDALFDDSPSVTREANQAIESHIRLIEPERLWIAFGTDIRLHVRRALLSLIDKTGSWAGLPYLMRVAADENELLASSAKHYIERRYNRVFTKPSEAEQKRVQLAWRDCAPLFEVSFRKALGEWLAAMRIG
jgi:HEAT repeat protein